MNINSITGVDVNRDWILYDNDLVLVDGLDNLYQAIVNRLSCVLDDLGYFYDGYGSRLYSYMGNVINPSLLQSVANEVVLRLNDEPRLSNVACSVQRKSQTNILINIKATVDESDEFDSNFLLNSVTRDISLIGDDTTQLILHIGLWDCVHQENILNLRKGEPILIQCKVLNSHGNPVPIGVVDYKIGGVHRSVEVENGRADLLFTFPEKWKNGEYEIIANYRGLGKFSPSTDHLTVTINDQWITDTELVHEYNYGIPWQEVMFPTRVSDFIGGKVVNGDVHYYLNWEQMLGTRLVANNMFTTTPTKGKAVWSEARVYDEWDNYVQCGCINFYIDNLDGMLKATQTVLENGYILLGTDHTFLQSQVYDQDYQKVCGGEVKYSYRELPQVLDTITKITGSPMIANGHEAQIRTSVIDEDDIGVLESDIDYYVRECGRCSPYDTITTTENSYLMQGNRAFTNSTVVDEDYVPVRDGDIVYSLDTLPIAVTTHDIEAFSSGARYGAMILDMNDNIIDAGTVLTQNGITNYVSSDEDLEKKIQFKLTGVDK